MSVEVGERFFLVRVGQLRQRNRAVPVTRVVVWVELDGAGGILDRKLWERRRQRDGLSGSKSLFTIFLGLGEGKHHHLQAGIELSFAVLPESAALFQPGERPLHHPSLWKHHEGVQFVALHHFHRGSQQALHRSGKGLSGVTPVHQHVLHLTEGRRRSNIAKAPARSVTSAVVTCIAWGLRVHRDVTLDSRHLLACVIALVLGGSVFLALGVHDTEAGALSVHCFVGPRQPIFFRTCSRMES